MKVTTGRRVPILEIYAVPLGRINLMLNGYMGACRGGPAQLHEMATTLDPDRLIIPQSPGSDTVGSGYISNTHWIHMTLEDEEEFMARRDDFFISGKKEDYDSFLFAALNLYENGAMKFMACHDILPLRANFTIGYMLSNPYREIADIIQRMSGGSLICYDWLSDWAFDSFTHAHDTKQSLDDFKARMKKDFNLIAHEVGAGQRPSPSKFYIHADTAWDY